MEQTLIPLTNSENALRLTHDRLEGDGNCTLVTRLEGWLEPGPLRAALRRLQERHPRLRARIVGSPDGMTGAFVPGEPVEVPVEVRDLEDSSAWPQVAVQVSQSPFASAAGPLLRVLLLRHAREGLCHLVVTIHHAVADAVSLVRCVHELLTDCAAARTGAPEPVVSLPWLHPIAPGTPLSRWRRLRFAAGLVSQILRNLLLPPLLPRRDPSRSESLHPVEFSTEQTTALLARTRQEKCTLNSTLFAAGLLAVRTVSGASRVRVSCQNTLRLQKFATPGNREEHVGCFSYPFHCTTSVGGDCSLWDLARKCREDLKKFLQSEWCRLYRDVAFREATASPLLVKLLPRIKNQSPNGGLGRITLVVSSLGVPPVSSRYGNLSLTGFFGLGKTSYTGAALTAIGFVVQDRLCLSVVGHGVGDALTSRFASALEGHLLRSVAGVPAGRGVAVTG